jgi:hypothetical protein
MAQALNILLAGFIVLGLFPVICQPPLHSRLALTISDRAQTNRTNAGTKAEIEKTVKSLIDLMFRERKAKVAFEHHFRFSILSTNEKGLVDAISLQYSEEYKSLEPKIVAGILASGWSYEYQPVLLALGTKPLSGFEDAFEEAGSQIEAERKKTLSRRGLTEVDFYSLLDWKDAKDRKTLENNLTTLELINADIDRFIEQRINKAVLNENLGEMKKSISVKKLSTSECGIYLVGIKPIFKLAFIKEVDELKLIAFGDVL